jgi:hypothetical protein
VKTVLAAVFHGVCLVDGLVGLSPVDGFKPGAVQCAFTGVNIFSDGLNAEVLKPEQVAAATTYANKMFDQFIPDVLRIDTAVPSGYLTPCSDLDAKPLLCGGRNLSDDAIDITYDYLFAGAAIHLAIGAGMDPPAQFRALVSDGVAFSANSPGSLQPIDPTNPAQGHPAVSTTFPYSAPPL